MVKYAFKTLFCKNISFKIKIMLKKSLISLFFIFLHTIILYHELRLL